MPQELKQHAEPVPGYRLVGDKPLGRGAFGQVWRANGPGGFEVALKFINMEGVCGSMELRALDVIKKIRHPHLVSTFGSWEVDENLIVAMELAERTLRDRFTEAVNSGLSGIPHPEIWDLFLDAAKGLDYLNEPRHSFGGKEPQGIVHRDVKPPNLLIMGGSVKVADFGVARVLEQSKIHTMGRTTAYAAPEFFDDKATIQSDQYCLAVSYCEMRGGVRPFSGSEAEIMAGHLFQAPKLWMLPEAERAVVAKALAKTPGERWPSCRAFIEALHAAGAKSGTADTVTYRGPGGSMPDTERGGSKSPTGTRLPATVTESSRRDRAVPETVTEQASKIPASKKETAKPERRAPNERKGPSDESRKWSDWFESAITDDTDSITPVVEPYKSQERSTTVQPPSASSSPRPMETYQNENRPAPILVGCQCGNQFEIAPEHAGTAMQCPTCGRALGLPSASSQWETGEHVGSNQGMWLAIGGIVLGALCGLLVLLFLALRG